jgi:GNAT superfamily N-acetyltransferase
VRRSSDEDHAVHGSLAYRTCGLATCRRADSDDVQAVADLLIRSRQAAVGAIPAGVHSDVEPTCTGMGLGSRLIELAKSRRPTGLQLWTFVTNTGAQRFYCRHGLLWLKTTDGSCNEEQAPDVRFIWIAL